jgi:tRNA pseudouridine38-40 synthase
MNNFKLTIQYDGSKFNGWQIQKNASSVQEKIKSAIEAILKHEIVLTGAGRTDTGVHALGQVANFKSHLDIDFYRFKYSLNSMLPFSIRVKKMENVPEEFNSRYDAVSRSYLYFIAHSPTPFNYQYVYNYHFPVDIKVLNQLSEPLIGVHDFSSFTKYAKERDSFICNIHTIKWMKYKGIVVFFIEADRFLHGMVRAITGTLLMTAKTGLGKDHIINILKSENRESANASAPAKGLFLYKVKYPKLTEL